MRALSHYVEGRYREQAENVLARLTVTGPSQTPLNWLDAESGAGTSLRRYMSGALASSVQVVRDHQAVQRRARNAQLHRNVGMPVRMARQRFLEHPPLGLPARLRERRRPQ